MMSRPLVTARTSPVTAPTAVERSRRSGVACAGPIPRTRRSTTAISPTPMASERMCTTSVRPYAHSCTLRKFVEVSYMGRRGTLAENGPADKDFRVSIRSPAVHRDDLRRRCIPPDHLRRDDDLEVSSIETAGVEAL